MGVEIFDIEKFNILQDEEYYYFFRALNLADENDIKEQVITDEDGNILRIRTDRERFEETKENYKAKYNETDELSLEQIYDHIKIRYRKDTNCISLSSNANVAINYGRKNYNDRYILVRVPKKEMEQTVVNAGQYMLKEVLKRVESAIVGLDENDPKTYEIYDKLDEIDRAQTIDDLLKILEKKYTLKTNITVPKAKTKSVREFKSPHARMSSYQALTPEQDLEKNKIISKLVFLEESGIIKSLIPDTMNNNRLIQTIGVAFSSCEQIHYGDINGKNIIELQKELVDIFALLQQAKENRELDEEIVYELEKEMISFASQGKTIEKSKDSILLKDYVKKDNISLDEIFDLTNGKVEYSKALSIINKSFFLAQSQIKARELARSLRVITGSVDKFKNILDFIERNTFVIEPDIVTRESNRGIKLTESVSLDLQNEEKNIVPYIKELTDEELIEIIDRGSILNSRDIISNIFDLENYNKSISKNEYYATTFFDLYDWKKIGIEEFSISQKSEILDLLKEKDCIDLYEKIKKYNIPEQNIPEVALNIIFRDDYESIINSDNFENIVKDLYQKPNLSIDQIETSLGYYEIEDAEMRLKDYQKKAADKAEEILQEKKFASVLLPTGTGKTFVALTELLKHKDEPMLYLAPQEEILNQVQDYIIKYIHGTKGTLGKSKEEIVKEIFPYLKFETYSGLLAKSGKEILNDKYKFIVMDELHRTGAPEWEKKIDLLLENQDEDLKVLGITATPTRDIDDRNMADEMALKLGYSQEEIEQRKHIAIDMDLIDAIRLGLVVNPNLVTCEYNLMIDGEMENLLEKINAIRDDSKRNKWLSKYENLRKNVEHGKGIPEILGNSVKEGGKYIVYIPTNSFNPVIQQYGNDGEKLSSKEKVERYETYIRECLKDSGLDIECYSMLSAYEQKKNQIELENFEQKDDTKTKFMIVINKANEGIHIDGIDGIIWFRALDENSRILYLQQLGRAIYPDGDENTTKPIIIDLVNNSLKVNLNREVKSFSRRDDLAILNSIIDWIEDNDGKTPDIYSQNKIEAKYAAMLYRIQKRYLKYYNNPEEIELSKKDRVFIENVLIRGNEIKLWDIEFPEIQPERLRELTRVSEFELKGNLRAFYEINKGVDNELRKVKFSEIINLSRILVQNGVDFSKLQMTLNGKFITIGDIRQEGIDIEKIINDNNLDANFALGYYISRLRLAYNDSVKYKIEEDEKKAAEELGLIRINEKSVVAEALEVARVLFENGVDFKKLQIGKRIDSKNMYKFLLKEIVPAGINIEKIIEENGLDGDFPIGTRIAQIRAAYNGNGSNSITDDERIEAERLGLVKTKKEKEEEKTTSAETIEIARIFAKNGISLRYLQLKKEGVFIKLKDVKQDGVDVERVIRENGLDPEYPLGRRVRQLRGTCEGKIKCKIKPEEKEEAKELGLLDSIDPNKIKKTKKKEPRIPEEIKAYYEKMLESSEIPEEIKVSYEKMLENSEIPVKRKTSYQKMLEISEVLKENGVDLMELITYKKGKFFLLKELKQDGVDIERIIQEHSLDGSFNYGYTLKRLRQTYVGSNGEGNVLKPEERKKAEELGLVKTEEEKSIIAQTLEIANILYQNGVCLEYFPVKKDGKYTRIIDIDQDGIDIEKIARENGLDLNYEIGKGVSNVRRGELGSYAITPDEKKFAESLGLYKTIRDETSISKALKVIRKLSLAGIDFKYFPAQKSKKFLRLMDIDQEGVDLEKIAKENGLNLDFEVGKQVEILRKGFNKVRGYVIQDEERKEIERLGIHLTPNMKPNVVVKKEERKKIKVKKETQPQETKVSQTIKIARILSANGVDFRKVHHTARGENNTTKHFTLGEIKYENIDIERIIKENGLDPNFNLGMSIDGLRQAYRGTGGYLITNEEKKEVKELGLLGREKTSIAETLEILKILANNGATLENNNFTKKENGKRKSIKLKEFVQDGIDITKIIEENGLDPDFNLGSRVKTLQSTYNGVLKCKMEDDERKLAEELKVVKIKITGQEIGMATFDSSVEDCDRAGQVLDKLKDKTKEEGVK